MSFDPVVQAVRQAVRLCRTVQQQSFRSAAKTSLEKETTEPVTIADYGSQALICRTLQQHFPQDAVVAEEAGSQFLTLLDVGQQSRVAALIGDILGEPVTVEQVLSWLDFGTDHDPLAGRTWVIDPIDGTKGFIAMRHYAVGVGVLERGQLTGAIMAAPGYGDSDSDDGGVIFIAQDGQATMEPIAGGAPQPIHPSLRTDPASMHIVQSYEKEHVSKSRLQRVYERAGLAQARLTDLDSMEKYGLIACGDADVLMRLPQRGSTRPHMIWDHAAGSALVLAAGGRVTDIDGQPLRFDQGRALPHSGMIASSGGDLHDRLVAAAQAVMADENES